MNKKLLSILIMFTVTFMTYSNSNSDFIKGADVSMLKELEIHGAKFYNKDNKEAECMSILKSYGVNWIRIRTWVDPKDKDGIPLGGGNNNKEVTLELVKRAKDLGMNVLLDFHYSDFWADPSKQNKPKEWEGLSNKELEKVLYDYTKDLLVELKNLDSLPDMVQIGNELNGGMVWPNGKTWKQGKEEIGGYDVFADLLKSGIKAVKDIDPSIRIMIHLADGGDNELYRRIFDELTKRDVNFDIIGLSFYPYWHGSFDDLQANLNDISKRYDKDVIVVEIAYGYTLEDGDGSPNIFNATEERAGGFKASVEGQETIIRSVMNVLSSVPDNRGKGFFYWEPDWIPAKDAGWMTGEGNGWDNQAMFDFNGKPLKSLNAFKASPTDSINYGRIEEGHDVSLKTFLDEMPNMPAEVEVIMENGAVLKKPVEWKNISKKKLNKIGEFTVKGKVEGCKLKAEANITVSKFKNHIADPGFESGDIWNDSKWILDDKKYVLQMENTLSNVHSDKTSLSYWKDSDYSFGISQKIEGLENGIYKLRVWSMGAQGNKSMYLYTDNGIEKQKKEIIDTGWSNWNRFEISNIKVTNGTLDIGIKGNCLSGDWGKLDDFELIKLN